MRNKNSNLPSDNPTNTKENTGLEKQLILTFSNHYVCFPGNKMPKPELSKDNTSIQSKLDGEKPTDLNS